MSKKADSGESRARRKPPKPVHGATSDDLMGPAKGKGNVVSFPRTTSPPPGAEAALSTPLAIRPTPRDTSVLAEEDIALYRNELHSWREHQGEHVLIYGGRVHGFFTTRDEARRRASSDSAA